MYSVYYIGHLFLLLGHSFRIKIQPGYLHQYTVLLFSICPLYILVRIYGIIRNKPFVGILISKGVFMIAILNAHFRIFSK